MDEYATEIVDHLLAVLADHYDEWAIARRYFSVGSMAKLYEPRDTEPVATAELSPPTDDHQGSHHEIPTTRWD